MEYVQERITTFHAFDDPRPPLPSDVVVVVPLRAGGPPEATVQIFDTLETVEPERVVVPLQGAADEVGRVNESFEDVAVPIQPIWCNAPAVERRLRDHGVNQPPGKGRDVWLALGIAADVGKIVVVHDGDNTAYTRSHVPRLAWPIDHEFTFVKGYYARIEQGRLYGRLTRLLCHPLIEAVRRRSAHELPEFLGAFRYPLAGEYAMTAELARHLQLPSDWGLEVGMLAECFDRVGFESTAQTDLGRHTHDHRPVAGDNGLDRMADSVANALMSSFRRAGIEYDPAELRACYRRIAREYIDAFEADAAFNELDFDREDELTQVEHYAKSIAKEAADVRLPSFAESGLDVDALLEAGDCDQLR